MPKTTTAPAADGGVHTSAQPAPAAAKPARPVKPAHHQPTPPRQRDEHTGLGGSYVRDLATGQRRRAAP
ncbi:hypothetical protein [Melaminivora sp.]|uniref:hypothetical protein n=1 Tax=Melaminivora sp. TaxID=1933032 RepID=UPI0028B12F05|nr:hypothetical protein [Melaminivora sp.]